MLSYLIKVNIAHLNIRRNQQFSESQFKCFEIIWFCFFFLFQIVDLQLFKINFESFITLFDLLRAQGPHDHSFLFPEEEALSMVLSFAHS